MGGWVGGRAGGREGNSQEGYDRERTKKTGCLDIDAPLGITFEVPELDGAGGVARGHARDERLHLLRSHHAGQRAPAIAL